MRSFYLWALAFVLGLPRLVGQQDFPYEIVIDTISIPGLPGLHSYVFGQHDGKWLILGGRKDGIHARQPFRAFPGEFNNDSIFVIDPEHKTVMRSAMEGFPVTVKEQWQAANACFIQVGDTLYIAGGYSFSPSQNDHITFPYLSAISVSGIIQAIENQTSLLPHARQIKDDYFAVTGGHLQWMNGSFYLVGGHRFDGQYNPMGHNTYVQNYTNEVRVFRIHQSGQSLQCRKDTIFSDPIHLHRRDYNLLPQILPDGKEGLLISSGVFQIAEDLPFLYPVIITESGHEPFTAFNQYLSHYHSSNCALYNPVDQSMHNLFFGGMSQYHYVNGSLVKDDRVPFVKTISRVSRNAQGEWTEYKMNTQMPSLTGSSAEFFLHPNVPAYPSGIIKVNELSSDSVLIGYIYGGIASPTENPFSSNQTDLTKADANLYTVKLVKSTSSHVAFSIPAKKQLSVNLFPNPFDKNPTASFFLEKSSSMHYFVTNGEGKILQQSIPATFASGRHELELPLDGLPEKTLYLTFIFDHIHYVSSVLVRK